MDCLKNCYQVANNEKFLSFFISKEDQKKNEIIQGNNTSEKKNLILKKKGSKNYKEEKKRFLNFLEDIDLSNNEIIHIINGNNSRAEENIQSEANQIQQIEQIEFIQQNIEEKNKEKLEERLKEKIEEKLKAEEIQQKNYQEKFEEKIEEIIIIDNNEKNHKETYQKNNEENPQEKILEEKPVIPYRFNAPKKEDFFATDFLDEINLAMYDMPLYSRQLEKLLEKIRKKNNIYSLEIKILKNNYFFPLKKGISPLFECMEFFQNFGTVRKEKLKLIDDLSVPFLNIDYENPNLNEKKKYFNRKYIEKLGKKYLEKYKIISFCTIKCANFPKYAFIFSVMDEGNNEKEIRRLFFDKDTKYLGISYKNLGGNVCRLNITFAGDAIKRN